MKTTEAQKLFKEKYGVKAKITKDDTFVGYSLWLSYFYFIDKKRTLHTANIVEACQDDDWKEWIDENDEIIRGQLSIRL